MTPLSIAEAVETAAARWPVRGFVFQDLKGAETRYTFPAIERDTASRAAALRRLGLATGDRLGLVIVEPEDFVLTFLAALRLGVVAVPMYPPAFLGDLDTWRARTSAIIDAAAVAAVVSSVNVLPVLRPAIERSASAAVPGIPVDALRSGGDAITLPAVAPDDIAFLQFTSGSTSEPRGVMVPHRCILANATGIGVGLEVDPATDVGVTWLPLYHDMGLVGFVLAALCLGVTVVFMPTLRFLRNPSVWMEALHRHRGTISFGPNFAYALATKAATPERLRRWDLSCVKALGCGGEPINASVMRAFAQTFGEHARLPATALRPAYGLAESTLSVTMTRVGRALETRVADGPRFQADGIASAPASEHAAVEHVSVGEVLPGHDVRILGPGGAPQADLQEGEVVAAGPSVASGYFRNAAATAGVFRGGAVHTGDLGYLDRGALYITGRIKDLIIHNGRNIHPQTIEWVAEQVDGVRPGNVAAVSVPGAETEQIVIVLEARERGRSDVPSRVRTIVQQQLSLPVADVVCLQRGELPKTSSGKVRRHLARKLYMDGAFAGARRSGDSGADQS